MQAPAELVLDDAPAATPAARAFVAAALADEPAPLVDDARLVVTELVTNATLHGEPPVTLRVARLADRVRIEVEDTGRALPVQVRQSHDSMTGRGLSLVSAVSAAWGVEAASAGKIVWAELTEAKATSGGDAANQVEAEVDVDALLAEWDDHEDAASRHPVRLGAVPTELLLEAKAHIDNVVRELTLVRAEEASSGVRLPPAMAALVSVVTEDFAEARAEIKRQALESARRGEVVTELTLSLPLSAADAGERYLVALDEADRHARAARMLTLAPQPSHRAFRRWYVQALVDQLRATARGEELPPPKPFTQVLAGDVDELFHLAQSQVQLQVLQGVTAELANAASTEQVAQLVVAAARRFPGVTAARVHLVTERRTLRSIAWSAAGATGPDDYDEIPLTAELPGPVVVRTGAALFLRSLAQIAERFPQLGGYYSAEPSLHVVPLLVGGRALGTLTVTFTGGELDDDAQLSFVRALASLLAQSLDRVRVSERVEGERARERQLLNAQLEVLAQVVAGAPLAAAVTSLLTAVEAASSDGMLASVLLLDEDGQHLRHCAAPSLPAVYNEAIDGLAIGPAAGSCGTAAYRRAQVIVEDVRSDPLWADFRDLAARAGVRACWSTPIVGSAGELLGTFALYYPQPQRPASGDLALIDVLVRTVAMVVERSRADEAREQALAAQREAALTLQHSLVPEVPAAIGPVRLDARYRAGDPGVEVGGDWFDAIATGGGVMLVVGDVQGHDLQAAAVMGQLRTVARACAGDGLSPAGVLAGMDRYLSRLDGELLTTAVVVQLDPVGRRVTVASAGHLPPLLLTRRSDGWAAQDVPVDAGPPLAVGDAWPEQPFELPRESTLLLYTDGLVESRAWPLDHGLGLLRKTLEGLPVDGTLSDVLDAALGLLPTGSRGDDVAVLAAALPD